jgi:hypothetical protein
MLKRSYQDPFVGSYLCTWHLGYRSYFVGKTEIQSIFLFLPQSNAAKLYFELYFFQNYSCAFHPCIPNITCMWNNLQNYIPIKLHFLQFYGSRTVLYMPVMHNNTPLPGCKNLCNLEWVNDKEKDHKKLINRLF